MKNNIHMSSEERKSLIFEITLTLAQKLGIFKFTIGDVARKSQCSKSTIKHYYGGIANLRKLIIVHGQVNNVKWINEISIMEILK